MTPKLGCQTIIFLIAINHIFSIVNSRLISRLKIYILESNEHKEKMSFIFYFFFQIEKCIVDPLDTSISKTHKMPQQCVLKTEEVADNKRQTELGLMTVK